MSVKPKRTGPATVGYSEFVHRCERCGRALAKRGVRCRICGIVDGDGPVQPDAGDEGRFSDRVMLAQGQNYMVCHSRDHLLKRDVALKEALPELRKSDTVQRWLRHEALVLARLRHPNVVQLYHFGHNREGYFLVLELVSGRTLADVMRDGDMLSIERVVRIMDDVLAGVHAIHEHGVVHGQLRSDNVLIEENTLRPVIIGFGRAMLDGEEQAFTGEVTHHTAPELRQPGATASASSDLYALGRMLLALLAGGEIGEEAPQASDLIDTVDLGKPSESSPPAELSRTGAGQTVRLGTFEALVVKATAVRPELRYGSVAEMRAALHTASERLTAGDARPSRSAEHRPAATRIFVAEGDDAFQQLARQALRIAFFQKRVAIKRLDDGDAAIEAARKQMPQLLLLDARQVKTDAFRILTELRSLPGGSDARVVLVGAELDETQRARWEALGVHVVAEPVELGALVDQIGAIAKSLSS